jgi:hypothetical protein
MYYYGTVDVQLPRFHDQLSGLFQKVLLKTVLEVNS